MQNYVSSYNAIKQSQDAVLESMGMSSVAFSELHAQLSSLEKSSFVLVNNLHEEILAVYESSFDQLRPLVDSAFS
jgi:hypothetical protein